MPTVLTHDPLLKQSDLQVREEGDLRPLILERHERYTNSDRKRDKSQRYLTGVQSARSSKHSKTKNRIIRSILFYRKRFASKALRSFAPQKKSEPWCRFMQAGRESPIVHWNHAWPHLHINKCPVTPFWFAGRRVGDTCGVFMRGREAQSATNHRLQKP
jgi:hypothetical protein